MDLTTAYPGGCPAVATRPNSFRTNLWQRRYGEHLIRDKRDYERHVEYIHYNPVKHGYVSRVVDWPYSSFHRYMRQEVYGQDWADNVGATR